MRRVFAFFFLLVTNIGYSQSTGINYKALIKDDLGNVVSNQIITLQFSILQGAGMINVYQETHSPTTDTNGVVIANIGQGTIDSGVFNNINWGSDDHFLNVQIDTGSGLVDLGTTQFMAVPYALNAKSLTNESISIDNLNDAKSNTSNLYLGQDSGLNSPSSIAVLRNIGLGKETLKNISGGSDNIAIGNQSLFYNETGFYNLGIGTFSLYNTSSGSGNIGLGVGTLQDLNNGDANIAIGFNTMRLNTNGNYNTAIGISSGYNNISGNSNVFLGFNAGYNELGSNKLYIENSDAPSNDALIYGEFDNDILRTNGQFQIGNPSNNGYAFPINDGIANQILQTDGSGNLSWEDNTSGNRESSLNDLTDAKSDNDGTDNGSSIFIGINAGQADNGSNNQCVGIGYESLKNNNAHGNTAIGYQSLANSSVTGGANTAIGRGSLQNNTDGVANTAVGSFSLHDNISANHNVAIGSNSLEKNLTGFENTALGSFSLPFNIDGTKNTALGFESLYENTSGDFNTAVGHTSLQKNNASRNTALGYEVLTDNINGSGNTGVGERALLNNTGGQTNTAVGSQSLYNNTNGISNVAIGLEALSNVTTGSYNIGIGAYAEVPNSTGSYQIQMGNNLITYAGIQVDWSITSDVRWKKGIRELPYGLDVVKQLEPVDYIRINNESATREMGFIAQDLQVLLTKIGYKDQGFLTKDDKGYMSVRYNDLIALLTKAIQDQQDIIENQNSEIKSLSAELEATNDVQETFNQRLLELEESYKGEKQ